MRALLPNAGPRWALARGRISSGTRCRASASTPRCVTFPDVNHQLYIQGFNAQCLSLGVQAACMGRDWGVPVRHSPFTCLHLPPMVR